MQEIMNKELNENTTMESPIDSVNTQFQKQYSFEKLLPYADRLDDEARNLVAEIKGELGRAVMLRRLQPDCLYAIAKLNSFIKINGLKFSKDDHIAFVKMLYELLTIPNNEPYFINIFSTALNILLLKTKLISPEEMELEWRPLYVMVKRLTDSSHSVQCTLRLCAPAAITLRDLIIRTKVYFPVTATQEILDELRPKLCPLEPRVMLKTVELLEWFLPVQMFPKDHHLGFKLWFDEFTQLWEVCNNAPQWEQSMMWLLARLAYNNVGYIDWEPHIPLMFTRFVRCFNLPVYYKKINAAKLHKIDTYPISIWIVSVLGNGSSSQKYMEKFLETIETYFHQANHGLWVVKLKELFQRIVFFFICRVKSERYPKKTWELPTPDTHKLTDADITAFVKSVLPIAKIAMLGKLCATDACNPLRYLATLRPSLVIPHVLQQMYSTLNSLTEPHKLTAVMNAMAAVAMPMVQGSRAISKGYEYTEGPSQVVPLLIAILPGIDPNDTNKCTLTCRLISIYARQLPIADTSRCTAEMNEDERLVCESTSRFEDFIVQFFDKVFSFIERSTLDYQTHENNARSDDKTMFESISDYSIPSVCSVILFQSSDEIFKIALKKFCSFVTGTVLETTVSGRLAANVCRVFARRNGHETLRALVPTLSETILELVGDDDEVLKDENVDNRLSYAILLLCYVVDTPGKNLLPHIDTLTKVLDKILRLKSREGIRLACRALQTIFLSLANLVPIGFLSNGRDYNDHEYPYFRDWGQGFEYSKLKMNWYVPGEKEVKIMQALFTRYAWPEVQKIEEYSDKRNSLTRAELLTSLTTIRCILAGCEIFLPILADSTIDPNAPIATQKPFLPIDGVEGEILMPDGSNVRSYLSRVMSNLQEMLLSNSEDDTKSFSEVALIWSSLLLGKVRLYTLYEIRYRSFKLSRRTFEDNLVKRKGHLGGLYVMQRVELHQEHRMRTCHQPITATHKLIFHELVKLATSRYHGVRSLAQEILVQGFTVFPFSYRIIGPRLLEILAMDPDENHEALKGVLYLISNRRLEPLVAKRDWAYLRTLWPAIIRSKPSEKLSVIRLKETVVATVNGYFPMITMTMIVPDRCVAAAAAFWNYSPRPAASQPSADEVQEGIRKLEIHNEENRELYDGLVNDLLRAIVEENPHWRHRWMAMSFLSDLVHPDRMYPVNAVRYFVNALVHESLEERKIAMKTVSNMLTQQKRKHKKVDLDLSTLVVSDHPRLTPTKAWYPGVRPDNVFLQYSHSSRPQTESEWNSTIFVNQPYLGYYVWPKNLRTYAPVCQQPDLNPQTRRLTVHETEIDEFFSDPRNIEKLIKYHSLEEQKGKDQFNMQRANFFKSLFRNHGDVHAKHFFPHLRRLVAEKQESSQRCAAEIIAGMIRGSKHWPFSMINDMWKELIPIIREALNNLTPESVIDWGTCLGFSQERRDPKSQHWLLECVTEEPPLGDSTASSVECCRMFVMQSALMQQSWRLTELTERIMSRVEERLLANPFDNVRGRLGSVLTTIYAADLRFPGAENDRLTPRARDLLLKVLPKLRTLADDPSRAICDSVLLNAVADVNLEGNSTVSQDNEQTLRLFKTICKWISSTATRMLYGFIPGCYELFSIACQLENFESDEELSKTCSITIAFLANTLTLSENMDAALAAVKRVSEGTSWSARATCLSFLEVFVFYNMGMVLSRNEWVDCVQGIVLRLLEDERLEVREKAGKLLGGLLHCTFIPEQEALLDEFKAKSRRKMKKRDDLRLRHAWVLGLCAFIQAHPYDVPNYIPSVFEHLGLHLNDPQPIPSTIRKTLGNFKRTHYDGWADHAMRFTEEQLTILQDLNVPPPYYA